MAVDTFLCSKLPEQRIVFPIFHKYIFTPRTMNLPTMSISIETPPSKEQNLNDMEDHIVHIVLSNLPIRKRTAVQKVSKEYRDLDFKGCKYAHLLKVYPLWWYSIIAMTPTLKVLCSRKGDAILNLLTVLQLSIQIWFLFIIQPVIPIRLCESVKSRSPNYDELNFKSLLYYDDRNSLLEKYPDMNVRCRYYKTP